MTLVGVYHEVLVNSYILETNTHGIPATRYYNIDA